MKKLKILSAPHTPFDLKGEVDYQQLELYGNLLVKDVDGAFILGTTGEGLQCSVAERKQLAQFWNDKFGDKLDLILHVGALSIADVIELTKHAEGLDKIRAISVVVPCFFKPATVQAMLNYIKAIVAHTTKKFYYYHSDMVPVSFSLVEFATRAVAEIPNFVGIKFNSTDLYLYQKLMTIENLELAYGVDEQFVNSLPLGVDTVIGSTYNYIAPLYRKIYQAYYDGDQQKIQQLSKVVITFVKVLESYGGVAVGKLAMAQHGINAGDPRLPINSLSANDKQIVKQLLDESGLWNYY